MRWWLASLGVFAVGAVLAVAVVSACQSDSETPNPNWDIDGGVAGQRGQPCRGNSRCTDPTDVCIDENQQDTEPPYCRAGCDTSATNDPCGAGFRCVPIANQGTNGACLPAPGLGEACTNRCDDGLVCVSTSVDGGTSSACATACTTDNDCDSPQTCAPQGYCA
jgi:hypothetical protein